MKKLFLVISLLYYHDSTTRAYYPNDHAKRKEEALSSFSLAQCEVVFFDFMPMIAGVTTCSVGLFDHLIQKKLSLRAGEDLPIDVLLFGSGAVIFFLKYRWRAATWQRYDTLKQKFDELKELNNQ
jgi:hypothetical protein